MKREQRAELFSLLNEFFDKLEIDEATSITVTREELENIAGDIEAAGSHAACAEGYADEAQGHAEEASSYASMSSSSAGEAGEALSQLLSRFDD